jgi:hypothetical protein
MSGEQSARAQIRVQLERQFGTWLLSSSSSEFAVRALHFRRVVVGEQSPIVDDGKLAEGSPPPVFLLC